MIKIIPAPGSYISIGGVVKGGIANRVMFTDANGALAQSADLTFASSILTVGGSTAGAGVVVTGGTITASSPLFNGTQTWNNAAIAFKGIFANFIGAANAAAGALPVQIQVDSSDVFSVNKSGVLTTISGLISGASGIQFGSGHFLQSLVVTGGRANTWRFSNDATSAFSYLGVSAEGEISSGTSGSINGGSFDATTYKAGGTAGVASFGPSAVTSITVKGGIITAIS